MKRKIILSENKLRNYIKETIRQTILENFEMEGTPSNPLDVDKVLEYVSQQILSPEMKRIVDISHYSYANGNRNMLSDFTLRDVASSGEGPAVSEYYVYLDVYMNDFMDWIWDEVDNFTPDNVEMEDLSTEDVIEIIAQNNLVENILKYINNNTDENEWYIDDYDSYNGY